MGYSLVKHLDSVDYRRVLLYLDRGESDLPPASSNTFAMGSRAISQSTGQEWFVDSNYEWKPVRNCPGSKFYERNKYGGNEFEIFPVVKEVKIIPDKLTMNRNANAQLYAEAIGEDILDKRIKWEIVSAKKSDTYITQDGYLHIGNYTKPTVLTIRATSLIDEAAFSEISVQIDPYGELIGDIYGVSLSPNQPIIGVGQQLQFIGTVIGNGSYDKNVLWSISAASDSSIDEGGKLIIGENETYPVIIVTAKSVLNNKIVGSMPVIIKKKGEEPVINSVSIVPKTLTIGPGCFASLATVVDGKNNYIPDVQWSVTATSEDTLVTPNGMLIIGDDEVEGEIFVKATSVIDSSKYDEISVTISNSIKPTSKQVIEVIVEPNTQSVYKSYNALFSAKVVGINIYDQRVIWSVERNSSEYTKIKPNGSFTVASEEDSNSVIIKATSALDSSVFGLAAVEIINEEDVAPVSGKTISDIIIDENKNLIIKFSDGSEKIVGKTSSGVYVPHITQEEKILSFTYAEEPGEVPAPVDLSVDLSDYALKTDTILGKNVTAQTNIGGITKGTYYSSDSKLKAVVADMFNPLPEGEIVFYYGATASKPTDLTGLTKVSGKTKEELLKQPQLVTITIPAGERGQYPVLAIDNRLKLSKWTPPDQETWEFEYIELMPVGADYTLYYFNTRSTASFDSKVFFKEG